MNTVGTLPNAEAGVVTDRAAVPFAIPGYTWAITTAVIFALVLCLWHAFDHRVPGTDEAGHILNSIQYKDLWRHPRLWKGDWWHEFMTINQFYPPALYAFNGALKLVFGMSRWVDTASLAFFSIVLTLATYGIARIASGSQIAALVAAVSINLYPELAWLSHYYMLDFPLVAMFSAALWSMLWWHEEPSWKRAIASAALVTLACMSKQIVAAYLFLPGAWCLYKTIRPDVVDSRAAYMPPLRVRVAQILLIPAAVLAAAVPWFAANWQWIHSYSQENIRAMQTSGMMLSPPAALIEYLTGLAHCMSPLLLFAFMCGLLFTRAEVHRKLVPVYLSAIGGIGALSFLSWQPPLDRYVASCLVATAVVTGCGAARLMASGRTGRAPVIALLILAIAQFVSFSFTAYPIDQPRWLVFLARELGVELREYRGVRIVDNPPIRPTADYGQRWILDEVKSVDGNAMVWLNILPSDTIYNPHTFELLGKEKGMGVRPTTARAWTITGDRVAFDPKTALYYQWYLLKTGDQGNRFCDQQSEANYRQLIEFVRNSRHFRLVGEHPLAHGATLQLYRQTP